MSVLTKESGKSRDIAVGKPVRSIDSEDRRAKQLAAAEERARREAQRGLAPGAKKVDELSESARKQELIGRIQAHYYSLHREVPMGLNLASVEQLRKHYDLIKREGGSSQDILDS
jgi:hypothetical protein